jgi:hypothetical protein
MATPDGSCSHSWPPATHPRKARYRTVVELVAAEAVAGAEALDLALGLLLLRLEPGERRLPRRQRARELADERADRGPAFGGADPGVAVDVVWHRDPREKPRRAAGGEPAASADRLQR